MVGRPTILVFGEHGQVAWELARSLATLGRVCCAGRGNPRYRVDLADPDGIRSLMRELQPQWVVNAAAYTAVDKAEEEEALAHKINGIAPGVMAEETQRLGATLLHYSTDYVFDGEARAPYGESSQVNPQSAYGRTKLAGEQALEAVGGSYFILRTSWVYGARGHNFFLTMRRLMAEREVLGVVADQQGSPTCSRHIAEASAQLLTRLAVNGDRRHASAGIYHLSADGDTSWHGFANEILDGMRARDLPTATRTINAITTDEYPLPAQRPAYSVLDNSKLQREFQIHMPHWRHALDQVQDDTVA